jgi:hypothetical protein
MWMLSSCKHKRQPYEPHLNDHHQGILVSDTPCSRFSGSRNRIKDSSLDHGSLVTRDWTQIGCSSTTQHLCVRFKYHRKSAKSSHHRTEHCSLAPFLSSTQKRALRPSVHDIMLQCLTRRSSDLNGQREVDSPSKRPKPSLEGLGRACAVL